MPRQGQVCVLVHRARAVRVAVYPHTARIEDARDVLRARRFEQHAGPAVVDELGAGWVGDDVVDVRDRCEMHYRVAASDGPAHGVEVQQIADQRLDLAVVVRRLHEVEVPRRVPMRRQTVDDVRADESRAACDEDLHRGAGW